jgi:hypothetical protein
MTPAARHSDQKNLLHGDRAINSYVKKLPGLLAKDYGRSPQRSHFDE